MRFQPVELEIGGQSPTIFPQARQQFARGCAALDVEYALTGDVTAPAGTPAWLGWVFAAPLLMTVAYGGGAKQAGLDGHIIQPKKLQDIAG